MATKSVSLTAPTDYGAEQERIARARKYAEMLQQESMQGAPAGQMAGNTFVPTSPLSHLAKALQGVSARKYQSIADEDAKALATQRRTDTGSDMQAMIAALQGTPARVEQRAVDTAAEGTGSFDMSGSAGPETQPVNVPAVTPQQALQAALPNLRTPEGQQMGFGMVQQQIANQMKPPTMQDLGDRIALIKDGAIVGYLPKGATPDAALKEQGAQARHLTASGGDVLREQGAMNRHRTVSGNVLAQEAGANSRHGTASGSAILGAETQRQAQAQAVDPVVQGRLAEARSAGQTRGEAQAQAQITLPQAVEKANQAIGLIDQMIGTKGRPLAAGEKEKAPHPGFNSVVGATFIPGQRFLHGTDAASFDALLEQIKGGAFLQAFESLKGGGAITQVEGEKATQAITRMQRAQSESEFVKSAREFQDNVRKGMEMAQKRAGYNGPERRGVPQGVDSAVWAVMTPEEKALWNPR